ncbi:hypothetical protein BD626DRAFT_634076 [Schizophyllum amplum]|uniref:MYND-type domain-containing protein n=1 Tax=Schizophyllum amplum TaxID=97359 RepID=A0A550C0R6_9AGAR|nr:hypothetical protein BD626DRAFT_634076 [Auriculariopsis ampla]
MPVPLKDLRPPVVALKDGFGLLDDPPARQRYISQIKEILRSEDCGLPDLAVDPFKLPKSQWHPNSYCVLLAMGNLHTLRYLLELGAASGDAESPLAKPSIRCLRRIWSRLFSWIEFLHPGNGHVPVLYPDSYDYIEPLVRLFPIIFIDNVRSKIYDLLRQAPSIYRMLIDLWLRYPNYIQQTCSSREAPRVIVMGYSYIIDALQDALTPKDPNFCDQKFTEMLIEQSEAAVGPRWRILYELAVESLLGLRTNIDFVGGPQRLHEVMLYSHLRLIFVFCNEILPITRHFHRFLQTFVMQSHLLIEDGEQARMACLVVRTIWATSEDSRSMACAVRNGILPIMLAHNSDGLLNYDILLAARRSIYMPVTRALANKDGPLSFVQARFGEAEPELAVAMDAEIASRIEIMRSLHPRTCASPECTSSITETTRLRRCVCFEACYCSKACQKGHRQAHKAVCVNRANVKIPPHVPFRRPIDAYFARKVAWKYVQRFRDIILSEIDQLSPSSDQLSPSSDQLAPSSGVEHSPSSDPTSLSTLSLHTYLISIDFEAHPIPLHATQILDTVCTGPEPIVIVQITVGRFDSETQSTMPAVRLTLSDLRSTTFVLR